MVAGTVFTKKIDFTSHPRDVKFSVLVVTLNCCAIFVMFLEMHFVLFNGFHDGLFFALSSIYFGGKEVLLYAGVHFQHSQKRLNSMFISRGGPQYTSLVYCKATYCLTL